MTAEQLMQNYRFSEAARTLQEQIDKARSTDSPTGQLETDLRRANLAADMLRGTEIVTFIDSVKVPLDRMLTAVRLSSVSGSLVPGEAVEGSISSLPPGVGNAAFVNEIGDRLYISAADSAGNPKTISSSYKAGDGWTAPVPLAGMAGSGTDQDFPFVMPDGVTLYFAAQGEGSIGGYDVFVTRYNPDANRYVKAENLGMPFNSPANDYLLAIDEEIRLGWLVTDRNQNADTVCVYVFVPTDTREVYDLADHDLTEMVSLASLRSIALTQTDPEEVAAARARLETVRRAAATPATGKRHRRYVVNDAAVYTSLSQFRSGEARAKAEEADRTADRLAEAISERDALQRAVAQGRRQDQTLENLERLNRLIPQLQSQYDALRKEMRKAEQEGA